MCTQGLEPTEDLARAGVTGLLGTELLWRSNTGPQLLRHPSLQPKISTLRTSRNCFLRGKAALLYAISFIADLKPHHCSILRSAPEMERCRGGANTPQFLNQGQLVQTWTSSKSTGYLTRSLHEDGSPRLHVGASDSIIVLSWIYLLHQMLQFLLSITLILQLQRAFSTTSCLYNGNMLSALLLELAEIIFLYFLYNLEIAQ